MYVIQKKTTWNDDDLKAFCSPLEKVKKKIISTLNIVVKHIDPIFEYPFYPVRKAK